MLYYLISMGGDAMSFFKNTAILVLVASLLLSGCAMATVDELYRVPKRSEEYNNLQAAMDAVMTDGLEYSAPLSGENQQTVQMKDLNGDGKADFLLFAKGSGDKPLKVLVFSEENGQFTLQHTIESSGYAFDQVEYIQMDDRPGYELVVGRQVSDQVLRSVSVYTFADESLETLMSANYTKFLTCDLDADDSCEVMVLRPGQSDTDNGVAELYSYGEKGMERSTEVSMSEPVDQLKRIMVSKLDGGIPAVYTASAVEGSAMITDVFASVKGKFTNVSFSNESGTSVKTLRNYYVYAVDIDNDGVIELPSLISMRTVNRELVQERQYLIRWYAMTLSGEEVDKQFTYHNYAAGWYLRLDDNWAARVSVEHEVIGHEERFDFYVWDESYEKADKLLTVFALSGADREETAVMNNRFVLHKTDSTIFAANLEGASASYGLCQQSVIDAFDLIRLDWKTGEM